MASNMRNVKGVTRAGGVRAGSPLKQIRIKEPRQQIARRVINIPKRKTAVQRQGRRGPIARACETENTCGQRGCHVRCVLHPATGAIFGACQQRHIKPALKQGRSVWTGRLKHCLGRFQCAKGQKFIYPRLKEHTLGGATAWRVGLGQRKGSSTALARLAAYQSFLPKTMRRAFLHRCSPTDRRESP